MAAVARELQAERAKPPHIDGLDVGRGMLWVGLMAGGVACGSILVIGIANGISPARAITYGVVALLYLVLTLIPNISWLRMRWVWRHLWVYLLIVGLVSTALLALSGETFLQPLVFTLPIVYAALIYPVRRAAVVCACYLGLMNLGIWLGGENVLAAYLFPTVGYTTLMILIVAFARLSVEQSRARRHADELAADLARQRDYLARLSQITATLTRDLDLTTVLEHVAATGRAFAHADRAHVWLCDEVDRDDATRVRLAAAVPFEAPRIDSTAERWGFVSIRQLVARASGTGLVLPLIFKDATIGALELHSSPDEPLNDEDARLLQPFADAAAVAIENARLYEQAAQPAGARAARHDRPGPDGGHDAAGGRAAQLRPRPGAYARSPRPRSRAGPCGARRCATQRLDAGCSARRWPRPERGAR